LPATACLDAPFRSEIRHELLKSEDFGVKISGNWRIGPAATGKT
jgi:hypothetical protein